MNLQPYREPLHPDGDRTARADATPAPLDPSKDGEGFATGDSVRRIASDSGRAAERGMFYGRTYTVRDNTVHHDGGISVKGVPGMWSAEHFELVSRATAHQPAPEPEPEWEPGTTGTATLHNRVSGNAALGLRAMRVLKDGAWSFVFENGAWIRDDATTWSVTDFVPDEPRPLPTREQVAEAIMAADKATGNYGLYPDVATKAADAVLALLRDESR